MFVATHSVFYSGALADSEALKYENNVMLLCYVAIPMECDSSLLSDWESVLLEVQSTVADLEKVKKDSSASIKKHITLNI